MSAPAGWYPDPVSEAELRFYDGADWTAGVGVRLEALTSPWVRIAAWLLDGLLVAPVVLAINLLLGVAFAETSVLSRLISAIAYILVWGGYQFLSIRRWSATLGMRTAMLKVETLRGNLDTRAIAIRSAAFAILTGLSSLAGAFLPVPHFLPGPDQGNPALTALIVAGVTFLAAVPFFLDGLAMFWSKSNQAWHDRLAGTVVINQKDSR